MAEELGTGLGIGEAAVECEGSALKGGKFVGEEVRHEGIAADGLAKGAGTGGKLSRWAEDGEGLLEGEVVGGGQGRRGAGDGGEEFGFGEAKADAMGGAEFVKFPDVEG
jgi:hypothetical protein